MKMDITPNPSGAPEAGGATTPNSRFGGDALLARLWRFAARMARDLESTAYRRLKEMEARSNGETHPGAPKRTKEAGFTDGRRIPIT